METILHSLEELQHEAAHFIETLSPSEEGATLVTLSGELGAGKTSFTQAVAQTLGVTEHITSPTFVLEKIYELPENNSFKRLVHIDAYRLSGGIDLAPLRFTERMKGKDTLIMLEWPEKVADGLPKPTAALTFTVREDNTRSLSYSYEK